MLIGRNLAVTNHAIERLKQRMGISKRNIKKTVMKALRSDEKVCEYFLNSEYNLKKFGFDTYFYKQYNGVIFVFQKKYIDTVLLTVFKHEKDRENRTSKY